MADTELLDSIVRGRVDPYRPVEIYLDEWRNVYSGPCKKYEHIAKVDERAYFRDYSVHDFLTRNGFCFVNT